MEPLPGPDAPLRTAPARTFVNPVLDTGTGRDHGDPFVLRHGRGYYLYYTGSAGIEVWTGDDLVHWSPAGPALVAPDGDHWAQVDLWAPEVLYADGIFYMYVTGTRHQSVGRARTPGVGVDSGDDRLRRQGIARASDPLGPFVLDPAPLLDVWSIDGHPFVDVDGRRWLFYNVRDESTRYRGTVPGCGNLVDELVAPDAVSGRPTPVALPDAAWEGHRDGIWYWNEGPTVLRRRGRYVQMYSGGWYGDASYGVGFATADAPRGPWVKAPHNPVFVSGSAHHRPRAPLRHGGTGRCDPVRGLPRVRRRRTGPQGARRPAAVVGRGAADRRRTRARRPDRDGSSPCPTLRCTTLRSPTGTPSCGCAASGCGSATSSSTCRLAASLCSTSRSASTPPACWSTAGS